MSGQARNKPIHLPVSAVGVDGLKGEVSMLW